MQPVDLQEITQTCYVFQILREVPDAIIERKDVDKASLRISQLLDESVIAANKAKEAREDQPEFKIVQTGKTWDLSKLNIDNLKEEFAKSEFKHMEIADPRAVLDDKLQKMLERNIIRIDFAQRYQGIIDQYNSGDSATEIS